MARPSTCEKTSDGRFGSDLDAVYEHWRRVHRLARRQSFADGQPFTDDEVGPPVVHPTQVFGIGLNYQAHAPRRASSRPGPARGVHQIRHEHHRPYDTVTAPSDSVDWEVELVVVIGERARKTCRRKSMAVRRGLTAGQDLSDARRPARRPGPAILPRQSYPVSAPSPDDRHSESCRS